MVFTWQIACIPLRLQDLQSMNLTNYKFSVFCILVCCALQGRCPSLGPEGRKRGGRIASEARRAGLLALHIYNYAII